MQPSREDVYKSWLKVQELERELESAKAEHQRLADARYRNNAEQLRQDKQSLGLQ